MSKSRVPLVSALDIAGPLKSSLLSSPRGPNTGRVGRNYLSRKPHPRHRLIVMLHEAGWTNKEIAQHLHYSETRVSIIINSTHPELLAVRKEMQEHVVDNVADITARFKFHSQEALDVMLEHMRNTENANVSRLAARDILDRAGYSPVKRQMNLNAQVPAEALIQAAKHIEAANEVLERESEWIVRTPTDSDDETDSE